VHVCGSYLHCLLFIQKKIRNMKNNTSQMMVVNAINHPALNTPKCKSVVQLQRQSVLLLSILRYASTWMVVLCMMAVPTGSFAQWKPLNGSGKIVNKTFGYNNFDKVVLQDLAGQVAITIGKSFAVSVQIDDNFLPLLQVTENDGKLIVKLSNNKNNRLYIEKNNIKVNISMPEASVIENDGNTDVAIRGVVGRYFRLENYGNGNAKVDGQIDELDIVKSGNGDIDATGLLAKNAKVSANGNGDVKVNVATEFKVSGSGNGDVINKGAAQPAAGSQLRGNGEIIVQGRTQKLFGQQED
jgi:hypothetical protein